MIRQIYIIILSLTLVAVSFSAVAGEFSVVVTFSSSEKAAIHAYYSDRNFDSKLKRKGKKSLPPGIAKNLARGKKLPPGIAKRKLPADLIDTLPDPRTGFERVIVDGRVLLVEIATQIVHDVLQDLILR